jgi:parallel beta-helix repeat protein
MLKFTVITCLTIHITMAVSSHATEYYVAMDGYATNPGTLSRPWGTIAKANATLQPGDTVYIRAGTYRETIRPNRSGTEGKYITYSRYQNEEATITEVHDGADLSDRSYIFLDGLRITNVRHWWMSMTPNSTHNVIRNCHMEEAGGWGGLYITTGSDYNRVLNNTFIGKNCPGDLIWLTDSSYNLIEGNKFHYGTHQCVDIQSRKDKARWNIVRNNVVQNFWHTGLAAYPNADRTLIEGNIILDCGKDHKENKSGSERDRNMERRNHKGIQLGSQWCIVRNNVLVNNGSMSVNVYGQKKGLNNRIYHNVFYDNEIGVYTNTRDSVYGNVYKNNIFFRNREYEISVNIGGERSDNYFVGNNILGASLRYLSGSMGLSEIQALYQQHFMDNISLDPEFVDVDTRDFRLRPDSPMIDKAVFLTRTTSSGQGKVIEVEDASYFMDGWGIIEGDRIQLQDESRSVRVVTIDYESNLITVDQSISWPEGTGVSLAYRGSAPDIGAHEYGTSE